MRRCSLPPMETGCLLFQSYPALSAVKDRETNGPANHEPCRHAVIPCSTAPCEMWLPGSAGPALPAEIQNEPGSVTGVGGVATCAAAEPVNA